MASQVQEIKPQNQGAQKASVAPDPHSDPVAYLLAHGRKPLGNPDWPSTRWINANKPMFGSETKRAKEAHFIRMNEQTRKPEAVLEPVMANDGTGKHKPVVQIHYIPPQEPVSIEAALRECMEEDYAKQLEAERKAKQAA